MKIGIDMTWLKPKKSGGVESYIRNLLDGFLSLSDSNEYILLAAKDNYDSLLKYEKDKRVRIIICNTKANEVKKHLLWQNLCQYHVLKKNKISFCFFPVYEMPIYKNRKIKTVTTIQDIQAYHYPEYFSKLENIWFRFAWKRVVQCADRVVATTNYTKEDIRQNIKDGNNLVTIYIPIVINNQKMTQRNALKKKYQVEENNYYYTVSSFHKHKNLTTLIRVLQKIKEDNLAIPQTLIISGVGGPQKEEIEQKIAEMNLKDNIIFTDFISNEERNTLMEYCNAFLFPSTFEGFGMPPIEALQLGSKVITTKCTAIPEVTKNHCTYVEDPYHIEEWIEKIQKIQKKSRKKVTFEEYEKEKIARQYLDLFYEIVKR